MTTVSFTTDREFVVMDAEVSAPKREREGAEIPERETNEPLVSAPAIDPVSADSAPDKDNDAADRAPLSDADDDVRAPESDKEVAEREPAKLAPAPSRKPDSRTAAKIEEPLTVRSPETSRCV